MNFFDIFFAFSEGSSFNSSEFDFSYELMILRFFLGFSKLVSSAAVSRSLLSSANLHALRALRYLSIKNKTDMSANRIYSIKTQLDFFPK